MSTCYIIAAARNLNHTNEWERIFVIYLSCCRCQLGVRFKGILWMTISWKILSLSFLFLDPTHLCEDDVDDEGLVTLNSITSYIVLLLFPEYHHKNNSKCFDRPKSNKSVKSTFLCICFISISVHPHLSRSIFHFMPLSFVFFFFLFPSNKLSPLFKPRDVKW